jgi:hypothetical protein
MKSFIETKNKKITIKEAKRLLDRIQSQINNIEFHCSQHNNGCAKGFTCPDYIGHISNSTLVIKAAF